MSIVQKYIGFVVIIFLSCTYAFSEQHTKYDGNQTIESFNKAKKLLEKDVYFDHRTTLYCGATFDSEKNIKLPNGFETRKYQKRTNKIEWEHVVPAENFGQSFTEWRDGHPDCINNKGVKFKGRSCAGKTNTSYRYMQADMYNLYPSIGSVNALRSNYNFTLLPGAESDFGSCLMKIENNKAEPPKASRGQIARTYIYMEAAYPVYKMSKQQLKLMKVWSNENPVNSWECTRSKRIESIQKNPNLAVKKPCIDSGLW